MTKYRGTSKVSQMYVPLFRKASQHYSSAFCLGRGVTPSTIGAQIRQSEATRRHPLVRSPRHLAVALHDPTGLAPSPLLPSRSPQRPCALHVSSPEPDADEHVQSRKPLHQPTRRPILPWASPALGGVARHHLRSWPCGGHCALHNQRCTDYVSGRN